MVSRLPEVAVPLGTHTGWNVSTFPLSGLRYLAGLVGAFQPLARTKRGARAVRRLASLDRGALLRTPGLPSARQARSGRSRSRAIPVASRRRGRRRTGRAHVGRDRGPVAQGVRRSHMLIGQRRSLASACRRTGGDLHAVRAARLHTLDHPHDTGNRFDLSRRRRALYRSPPQPGARVSGDPDGRQARRAPEGARVRRHHRRGQDRHCRRTQKRHRTDRHAAHRTRRAAGRGEDRASLRQHSRDEERRRPVDAGDARVWSRPPHGRVGGHCPTHGRASRSVERHARDGRTAGGGRPRRRACDADRWPLHAVSRGPTSRCRFTTTTRCRRARLATTRDCSARCPTA